MKIDYHDSNTCVAINQLLIPENRDQYSRIISDICGNNSYELWLYDETILELIGQKKTGYVTCVGIPNADINFIVSDTKQPFNHIRNG